MFTWATSEALVNDLALTHEEIGLYIGNDPYIFPFAILSALFPIMIMLVAVGLWRNRLGPRWVPALFVVGAVAFLIFVVGGYMEGTLFPVPVFIWLLALLPMGWRLWTGEMDGILGETAVA
jgi:hypothetical protein